MTKQWSTIFVTTLALSAVFALHHFAVPARAAITPLGAQGCPRGSVVGGPNLIFNSNFSQGSVGFESDLPDRGPGVYPSDPQGGFSIQRGTVSYFENQVVGRPFPGDSQREVPPSDIYFYANPNQNKDGSPGPFVGVLWRQVVTVSPGTTYNFFGYFDNLLLPTSTGVPPKIQLIVDGISAGPAVTIPASPNTWIPLEFAFTTGSDQTSVALEIYDLSFAITGNDFGMTQIGLKQCVAGIGLAKFAEPPIKNQDGTYDINYTLTVRNMSPDPLPLTNVQIEDNLAAVFANVQSWRVLENSLQSSTLAVNPNFNGRNDINVLGPGITLQSLVTHQVVFTVRLTPGLRAGANGPFKNSATARALAATIPTSDASSPGLDPDPNGNGDARDPVEDVPTSSVLDFYLTMLPLVQR